MDTRESRRSAWVKFGLPVVPAMIEENRQFSLLDFESIKTAEAPAKSQAA